MDEMKKATKTPSKHTSWKRLEQIKRDHGVMASGHEHHQDELDSAIVDAKVRDAEKMVQEADRMQRRPMRKSALQKDAPKFRLPRIKSINTRPDQEVHQVPSGDSFDRNTTKNRIAAVAANRASRAIDASGMHADHKAATKKILPIKAHTITRQIADRPFGGTTGGAVYGIQGDPKSGTAMASQDHDASRVFTEHEGHHLLFRQVADQFGEQGRHKLVDHILSHFHPEDVDTMGKVLGSGSYDPKSPRFKEEIANALRDLNVNSESRELATGMARASGHNLDLNRVKSGLKNASRSLKNLDESFFHEQPQKLAASELEKSRPRITFPRFKRITTRPDQEIHEVGSERQKKIFGRKVAAANIPDSKDVKRTRAIQKPDGSMEFQDLPPGTISRQEDRDSAAKRISRTLGSKVLGTVHHTKRGPMGAVLSGKMYQSDFYQPKSSGGGAEYEAKLKEHYDKRNQMVRDYNSAFSDWHKKGMELSRDPSKLAELHEHLAKKPIKPKLPRKPSRPRVKGGAEERLSREDMATRGRSVAATTEHEGLHYIIDKVRGEYGKRAAKTTLDKLVDAHDPEAISHLSRFLSQKMGYKHRDPSFKEELIAHARDILVNPRKRESFKAFVGEDADKVISALKTGHQKAYKVAQSLNPEDVAEQSDFDGGKLAASEINKATMAGELAAGESGGLRKNRGTFKLPRFTKLNPRQDQEVQQVDTPRQQEIYSRKVAGHFGKPGGFTFSQAKEMSARHIKDVTHPLVHERNVRALKDRFGVSLSPKELSSSGAVMGDNRRSFGMVHGEGANPTSRRREHEAVHMVFNDLKQKYGQEEHDRVLSEAIGKIHPEVRQALSEHMSNVGYAPHTHDHEYIPHLFEMLHDPSTRKMMGGTARNSYGKGMIDKAKKSWKDIVNYAKTVKPK